MTLEITVATLQDIPDLCTLLNTLFAQEVEFTPNASAQKEGLTEVINNPDIGKIVIARKNGEAVGMLNLLFTVSTALGSRVALLEDMVVSPTARQQGVGSALMDYAIKLATAHGCKRITLLTDMDNSKAQQFYEKHGFSKSTMIPFRLHIES